MFAAPAARSGEGRAARLTGSDGRSAALEGSQVTTSATFELPSQVPHRSDHQGAVRRTPYTPFSVRREPCAVSQCTSFVSTHTLQLSNSPAHQVSLKLTSRPVAHHFIPPHIVVIIRYGHSFILFN